MFGLATLAEQFKRYTKREYKMKSKLTKITSLTLILLSVTVNAGITKTVKIKSGWDDKGSLVSSNDKVYCTSATEKIFDKSWVIEKIKKSVFVRIRSKKNSKLYLNNQDNKLKLSLILPEWESAKWLIVNYGEFVRIQSAENINSYLNIENNTPKVSTIKSGMKSAWWIINL